MEKIKVLLVSGELTGEHNYRRMNELLRLMLESTGRFTVKITEEFNGITETTLEPYQLILLNYDGKNLPSDIYKRWHSETESVFINSVKNGKGLMIHHSSCWLEGCLPEDYKKIWGTYLCMPESRRRPKDNGLVQVLEPLHPIMKGLTDFYVVGDDFFTGSYLDPNSNCTMLTGIYDALTIYEEADFPPPHHPVLIPENNLSKMRGVNQMQPLSWVNTYGDGRIFACSIGHDIDTYRRVEYLTMFVRGCEWAATGEVTINRPDRSGENRLNPWPYYQDKY